MSFTRLLLLLTLAACLAPSRPPAASAGTLAVWRDGAWRTWWRSDRAPQRWSGADPVVAAALRWQPLASGAEWASLRMACPAPAWRSRIVVVRLDPRRLRISLDMRLTPGEGRPGWSIDDAPADAVLAVNAGQFVGAMPWGWVVVDGAPRLSRGFGPLASAVSVDRAGIVRWTHGDGPLAATGAATAFQSYPTLLAGDGRVPAALRTGEGGLSLTHRDARLALGEDRAGRLLVVLTRFDAAGELAGMVPLGPTTPEMAGILGALGATDAVLLDGGVSAQLLLRRGADGRVLRWPGLRKVPLALIARERPETAARAR